MIIAGILLIIYGGRNPTTASFVMTFVLVGTIILIVFYARLPPYTPSWSVFLISYFAFGNGAVLALGSTLSPRIGVTICGASFGFFVGLIFDLIFIVRYTEEAAWANFLTILFFVLLFTILTIPLYDYAVLLSSSTYGSYFFWRVSSLSQF